MEDLEEEKIKGQEANVWHSAASNNIIQMNEKLRLQLTNIPALPGFRNFPCLGSFWQTFMANPGVTPSTITFGLEN